MGNLDTESADPRSAYGQPHVTPRQGHVSVGTVSRQQPWLDWRPSAATIWWRQHQAHM